MEHPIQTPTSPRTHAPTLLPAERRELEALGSKVKQEATANRRRYEKLLTLNPYFTMKLLEPSPPAEPSLSHAAALARIMRQLDLLLDEGSLLEKEAKKAELRRMQADHTDPSLRDELKHHFAFLRRVWLDSRDEANSTLDRIDELNKRVVIVKNGILNAADHEKKKYELKHDHYQAVERRAREAVSETEEYRRLRERWECLSMKLQERESQMAALVAKYEAKLQSCEEQIICWRREAEEARRSNKELKEKLLTCEAREARLTERIAELEAETRRTRLQPSAKENSDLNEGLAYLKDGLISQIKFRKMELPDPKRDHTLSLSEKAIPTTPPLPQPPQPLSLNEIREPETPLQPEGEETARSSRSIDRKGRFTRMRSPANGKLIKPRAQDEKRRQIEALSPRAERTCV